MKAIWPRVKLGQILQLQRRWIKLNPMEEYTEIGVRSYGRGIFQKPPVSGVSLGNKRVLQIIPGDLVFMNVFAWEGAVAVASDRERGTIGSHRFATYTVNNSSCDPCFLQLFFQTVKGRELLGRVSPGSAGRNRTMNLAMFAAEEIPLPALEEQQRIVDRVRQLAAKISEAQCLRLETLKAKDLLWQSAARGILKRSPHRVRPLGEMVSVRGGGTPSKGNPVFWEGAIPWISPKDMKVREITDAIDHISEAATEQSSAKLIPPGAVLVVIRGMILVHTFPSAVLRVSAAINQDMKALAPSGEILPEYLCTVMWAFNDCFLAKVQKSTHDTRKIETHKLLEIPIPVPTLDIQRKLVDQLFALSVKTSLFRQMQSNTAADLDALLPSILDKAFKGEI